MEQTQSISEKHEGQTHPFGCYMLRCFHKNWDRVLSVIDEQDIYNNEQDEYGLEIEPHITCLYGLHDNVKDVHMQKINSALSTAFYNLVGVSCFNQPNYDVLKYDIDSEHLMLLNKHLRRLPHTLTFPDYHPHMTIVYLKPGTGKKYVKTFKNPIKTFSNVFMFSKPDGSKTYFKNGQSFNFNNSLTEAFINERPIGNVSQNVKVDISLIATKHSTERQDRHSNDHISERDILDTANKAVGKIAQLALLDVISVGDNLHIKNNSTTLNLIGRLERSGSTLNFVIITVMKKSNFVAKKGTYTVRV